jgi:hypothetical protein
MRIAGRKRPRGFAAGFVGETTLDNLSGTSYNCRSTTHGVLGRVQGVAPAGRSPQPGAALDEGGRKPKNPHNPETLHIDFARNER